MSKVWDTIEGSEVRQNDGGLRLPLGAIAISFPELSETDDEGKRIINIIILHTPKPAKIDKNRSAVQCQQPSPASALLITGMHNIKDLYFGIWN
ncbi:16850_t:CDS:2 [Rhizophagus irregularis]|nr:16850_t:CDS:2 [Rhizophagus irregularis]